MDYVGPSNWSQSLGVIRTHDQPYVLVVEEMGLKLGWGRTCDPQADLDGNPLTQWSEIPCRTKGKGSVRCYRVECFCY